MTLLDRTVLQLTQFMHRDIKAVARELLEDMEARGDKPMSVRDARNNYRWRVGANRPLWKERALAAIVYAYRARETCDCASCCDYRWQRDRAAVLRAMVDRAAA